METPQRLLTPRTIGTTGIRTFPVAFDGSVLGWVTGVEVADDVLGRFLDAGGTLVSTAGHYAGGRSEMMIGNWLARHDRSRVLVATKVGRHPDDPGLSRRAIERSVEAALERLRTDYIDFLSFDGDLLPEDPGESFETVADLIRAGSVRFLSAAHFEAPRARELLDLAAAEGYPLFQAVHNEYSLMVREASETHMIPLAVERGLGFLARLPLASGYLMGGIRSPEDLPENAFFDGALAHLGRRGSRVLGVLERIALEHGTAPANVALSWVLSKPGVTAAVVRMWNPDGVVVGFDGSELALTRQQVAELDDASA